MEKAAVERGRRREKEGEREGKEGEEAGKHVLLTKPLARQNGFSRPQVSVCRIHKGETKQLRRMEPNSVNGVHFEAC